MQEQKITQGTHWSYLLLSRIFNEGRCQRKEISPRERERKTNGDHGKNTI